MANSPKSERLEAVKQIRDLEKQIGEEQEKARRAALDAEKARIDNRQERRKEDKERAQAERVLASNSTSEAQKAAARDRLAEIDIDRRIRAEEIARKQQEAGIPPGALAPGTEISQAWAPARMFHGQFLAGPVGRADHRRCQQAAPHRTLPLTW